MISTGSEAPDFTLQDHHGQAVSLQNYRGSYLMLIFYPGDNTLVCTRQLCNYRDNWEEFQRRKISLLGINPAPVELHREFANKYNFPFPLLADTDKSVGRRYGAIGFLGITKRAYVLIDPEGKILYSEQELTALTRKSTYKLLSIFDAIRTEQTV
jgi:peroxiredoxin Q/BCP